MCSCFSRMEAPFIVRIEIRRHLWHNGIEFLWFRRLMAGGETTCCRCGAEGASFEESLIPHGENGWLVYP